MNRESFLRELAFLLSDLEEDEREEALQYYKDYFDEVGSEHESEILVHIGIPEKVAAELKNSLRGGGEGGEYTERGYYDERFDEYHRVPDHYAKIMKHKKRNEKKKSRKEKSEEERRNGLLFLLLFLFFGISLAGRIISAGFSVITAILGGVFGLVAGLFGLLASGFAAVIGLLVGGVTMVLDGIRNLSQLPTGLMGLCFGFLMLAAAMLIALLTKWGWTTVMPWLLHFWLDMFRKCWNWLCQLAHKIFGGGGAEE